ncbi:MAG: hypothetical protein ACRCT6_08640, partial [Notoacmeibacter sp.]
MSRDQMTLGRSKPAGDIAKFDPRSQERGVDVEHASEFKAATARAKSAVFAGLLNAEHPKAEVSKTTNGKATTQSPVLRAIADQEFECANEDVETKETPDTSSAIFGDSVFGLLISQTWLPNVVEAQRPVRHQSPGVGVAKELNSNTEKNEFPTLGTRKEQGPQLTKHTLENQSAVQKPVELKEKAMINSSGLAELNTPIQP